MQITHQYSSHVYHLSRFLRTLEVLERKIKEQQAITGFEAIAFRGTSGAALAFPLFAATGIPIIHSRKPGSHCQLGIEGAIDISRYAIVDDIVESGETLREIVRSVRRGFRDQGYPEPTLTDVFLVKSDPFDTDNHHGSNPEWLDSEVSTTVNYHGLAKECRPYED